MVLRILSSGLLLLCGLAAVVAGPPPVPAPYSHLQISGDPRGFWVFDQETGNVYRYDVSGARTKQRFVGAVTQPGKPLSSVPATYDPAVIPRSQRRALANEVIQELRILSAAMYSWAIENNKPGTAVPTIADLAPYIHPTSRFRYFMDQGKCQDSLGNPIIIPPVDGLPVLSRATYEYFTSVVTEDFWIPFPVAN